MGSPKRAAGSGSGGPLVALFAAPSAPQNAVAGACFALFGPELVRSDVLTPTRCGNGHKLTLDNLALAERGTRRRCRQCGAERAAAWRRRRRAVA
jgi:hypothetical protein